MGSLYFIAGFVMAIALDYVLESISKPRKTADYTDVILTKDDEIYARSQHKN